MPERIVDLKSQRLIISQNLGNDFVGDLESDSEAGDTSEIIKKTREALSNNPDLIILGYQL